MERLTIRAKDQQGNTTHAVWYNPYVIDGVECIFPSSDKEKRALEKLAAYEDAGLMPDEVEVQKRYRVDGMPLKRFVEILAAEEDGRLIILPCKVGNTVWKIVQHQVDVSGYRMEWETMIDIEAVKFKIGMTDAIGKTIFLSREEAEAAWKEANNGE